MGKWLLRQGVTSIYKINKGENRTQVALLSSSDAPSSDAQGNHFASTVASKNHNGHGGPHRETGTRSTSNQIGPAYAYKVHCDHGAAGVISI